SHPLASHGQYCCEHLRIEALATRKWLAIEPNPRGPTREHDLEANSALIEPYLNKRRKEGNGVRAHSPARESLELSYVDRFAVRQPRRSAEPWCSQERAAGSARAPPAVIHR